MAGKNVLREIKRRKAQALIARGDLAGAARILECVCKLSRFDVESLSILGGVYRHLGENDRAVACLAKVAALHPEKSEAHFQLGIALLAAGKPPEAVGAFRRTITLDATHELGYECLAQALDAAGEPEAAVGVLQEIVARWPAKANMWNNLGVILHFMGRNSEAVQAFRQSLRVDPSFALAFNGLGSALLEQGRCEEALMADREGLAAQPTDARGHSNLLMTLNYLPDLGKREVYEEHAAWGRAHSRPRLAPGHHIDRDPDRRLKVGYVSSDFRTHSVAYFIAPLLATHDRSQVETLCYSSSLVRPDSTTKRLMELADHWREVTSLEDGKMADLIRQDRIDILVDLSGHTSGNRLPLFSAKPAPIQVTYLGYANTTGLSQMDYRLTDIVADPAGEEGFFTEKLVRLPRCFLCYGPMPDCPEVAVAPVLTNGFFTFGSFNNVAKMNEETIALWARAVLRVPGARLVLKNRAFNDEGTRQRYEDLFARHGLAAHRLDLLGHISEPAGHLAQYGRVDIALDTFPYNGTTTTCEALWMGVPVLTLAGDRHVGRVGASILSAIGHQEWIAHEKEEFVRLAVALAKDEEKLAVLRRTLRVGVAGSPLCDGYDMAGTLENTFRGMWRQWVAGLE